MRMAWLSYDEVSPTGLKPHDDLAPTCLAPRLVQFRWKTWTPLSPSLWSTPCAKSTAGPPGPLYPSRGIRTIYALDLDLLRLVGWLASWLAGWRQNPLEQPFCSGNAAYSPVLARQFPTFVAAASSMPSVSAINCRESRSSSLTSCLRRR